MHVLVLAQYFPPDMGGGATRAYNVAKGLSETGCKVTIVSAFPHYPTGNIPKEYKWKPLSIEYKDGMKIIRTFVPPLASEGFLKRVLLFTSFIASSLLALVCVGKIDVIWAANPNIISFYPSLVFRFFKRRPIVLNVDDLWPEALSDLSLSSTSLLVSLGEFMAGIAYRLASGITPISPAYVSAITDKYEVNEDKILVVPAGVDLDRFPRKERIAKGKGDKFRVLYIGALSTAYDFDQVFNAAKLLAPFNGVELVIQGGGELSRVLKSKLKETALSNISVVDRIVTREKVSEVLGEADALLLPLRGLGSIELGISSKLYEYQAASKPILCCSNGQPGRYILETESGIVVRPGDYEALAKSIISLKENQDLVDRLGQSGRIYVEENLSINKIGSRMKRLFEELM